jgi:hypothetical protein
MKKLNITSSLKTAALNAGGGVAAAAVNKLPFVAGVKNKMVLAAGKLLVGAFLPSILGKGKSKGAVESAAAGWNTVAGLELVNSVIAKNDPTKALGISGMPAVYGYNSATSVLNNGDDIMQDDVM